MTEGSTKLETYLDLVRKSDLALVSSSKQYLLYNVATEASLRDDICEGGAKAQQKLTHYELAYKTMVVVKPIRYYQLFNNGIGIVIWAQLVHPDGVGNVLWDGRYEKGGSATLIGQSSIVDLAVTGIEPGVPFYLSSHTLWGIDQTERAQQFIYEPESNLMASAVRAGPARAGQLSWAGTVAW